MFTRGFKQMIAETANGDPAVSAKAVLVVAAFIWVFAEAFGGILAADATDVNSGPVLSEDSATSASAREA
jgi:hypothetical protein